MCFAAACKWARWILGVTCMLAGHGVSAEDGAQKEWTVMVYMNAKNNLEPFALSNFHSMATVGSTSKVSVVAQLGRPSSFRYTNEDGNWAGVYRFLVNKDSKPRPEQAKVDVAASGDSTDMGSPLALRQFIQWSKKAYPAKRYMLVIWNHGQGWRFQLAANSAVAAKLRQLQPWLEAALARRGVAVPVVRIKVCGG